MFSGSQLLDWAQQMMVQWHNADPVSEKETNRNQVIYHQIQHNRNPFIDCPELVDYLFGSRVGEAWYPTCFEWNPDDIEEYAAAELPTCHLYPNPASDAVTIESDHIIYMVELFDVAGRLLQRHNGLNERTVRIGITDLKSGYYFVKIATGDATSVVTFVRR